MNRKILEDMIRNIIKDHQTVHDETIVCSEELVGRIADGVELAIADGKAGPAQSPDRVPEPSATGTGDVDELVSPESEHLITEPGDGGLAGSSSEELGLGLQTDQRVE